MNSSVILLMTEDIDVEEQSAEAARELGARLIMAKDVDEAIQTVCARDRDLGLAIVDFDNDFHGMTLLGALGMLRDDLPIVVIGSNDIDHAAALAYANGAAAYLAKPVNATELEIVIRAFGRDRTPIQDRRIPRPTSRGLRVSVAMD